MKKIIALLAATAASVSLTQAQELSVTTDIAWESAYVFRGEQLARSYFAPGVDVAYGDFYAGIWAALPVSSGTFDTEVDYYVGHTFALENGIELDIGATYYTFPSIDTDFFSSDNSLEFYIGGSLEAPFSPSAYLFHDIDLDTFTFEFAAGESFLLEEDLSLDVDIYGGHVAVSGSGNYLYYGVSTALSYTLTPAAVVSASVNYGGSENRLIFGDKRAKLWFGLSVTAGF
ncbi:MAG: hypothetical protein JJU20_02900 [Opitutales bacterium]|nr:hypothetical protein [Opitutales bacterium]